MQKSSYQHQYQGMTGIASLVVSDRAVEVDYLIGFCRLQHLGADGESSSREDCRFVRKAYLCLRQT